MKPRVTALVDATLVLISLLVGVLLCEVVARIVLNPADYLSVTTLPDDILGMRIAPDSPGFDRWGFRNASVPRSADIVTVGDSHTFGNTATREDAWPSVLQRESRMSVYNLGVGGYGPNQYFHLLTTRGLSLHPKWVLCGLYFGDDFENAFSITYGLQHWASFRWDNQVYQPNVDIWDDAEAPGPFELFRNWLSRRSVMYRLVVHGSVVGAVKETVRFRRAGRDQDPLVTSIQIPEKNIREAFRPASMASRLDQSRPEVREGMRVTLALLKDMDRACRNNGCSFVVVLIPTKESVFAEYLRSEPTLHLRDAVEAVISNEKMARAKLTESLEAGHISYIDTLPSLRRAVSDELYARTTADMHPGKNGYRVIGQLTADFISQAKSKPPPFDP